MAYQQTILKNSGRRSPGQIGRNSPTNNYQCKKLNNNNNNNSYNNCCNGHQDTQQLKRHSNEGSHPKCHSNETSHPKRHNNNVTLTSFIENRNLLVQTFLFFICVAVYWNSLPCDFVFDDVTAIRDNRDLRYNWFDTKHFTLLAFTSIRPQDMLKTVYPLRSIDRFFLPPGPMDWLSHSRVTGGLCWGENNQQPTSI